MATRAGTAVWMVALLLAAPAAGCSGGSGGGSVGGGGAPQALYSGALAGAVVPGWDPSNPRPLVIFGAQNGGASYFTSAHVGTSGTLDGIAVDTVKVWGWDSGAGPSLLFHGALSAAVVPGWNDSQPRPLIVYARLDASSGGYSTVSGLLGADGTMSAINADEVWIWGWSGGPSVRYDGVLGSAMLPSWSAASPSPFLFGVHSSSQSGWYDPPLAVQVLPDGRLTNLVTDRVVVWGF